VASQEFATAFKNLSGKDLNSFMEETKGMSPKDALVNSMSEHDLPSEVTSALASTMDQVQEFANTELAAKNPSLAGDLPGSTLSSGGGAKADSGSEMPPFNAMMQNMLAQFMPQMGEPTEKDKAIATIIFANQKFDPTAIMENRKLNIFDRITYRYLVVGKVWYPARNGR
jgi:hypothetical protein